MKRSFWPFSSGSDTTEDEEVANENDPSSDTVETVSADAAPQQFFYPQQQYYLPSQLQSQLNGQAYAAPVQAQAQAQAPAPVAIVNHGNRHYPIYRVHKYNGVLLKPIPVSLVGQTQGGQVQGGPVQGGVQIEQIPTAGQLPQQYTYSQYVPYETINAGDDNRIETGNNIRFPSNVQTPTAVQPPTASGEKLQITPELIELGRKLGITDFSRLPPLDDAMALLGTTTQAETLKVIQEIAATEDGLNLIKQYLTSDEGNDQDGQGSETVEQYALPGDDAKTENDPLVAQSTISLDSTVGAPVDLRSLGEPFRSIDAALDRTRTSIGVVERFLPQPDPEAGILSRIAGWANILNPLAGRGEVPIPTIEADAEEIVAADNSDTIPIPNLPELPRLPVELEANTPNVPSIPQIHIPQGYILPPHLRNAGPGGPYIRVKLPLSSFNPTPEIPIEAKYLNHYQRQLMAQPQLQLRAPHVNIQSQFRANHGVNVVNNTPQLVRSAPAVSATVKTAITPAIETPSISTPAITQISQIPLSDSNYEIFRNAPRIVTSYGSPALPYTYPDDRAGASFSSSSGFKSIPQTFDYTAAASEVDERKVPAPEIQAESSESLTKIASSTPQESFSDDSVSSETTFTSDSTKSIPSTEPIVDEQKPVEPTESVAVTEPKSSSPLAKIQTEAKRRTQPEAQRRYTAVNSDESVFVVQPQRLSGFDAYATGKLYSADPDAVNLFPLTMQYAAKEDNE